MGDCFVDAATAARTERRRKPGNASSPEEQANLILDEARDRADSVIAQAASRRRGSGRRRTRRGEKTPQANSRPPDRPWSVGGGIRGGSRASDQRVVDDPRTRGSEALGRGRQKILRREVESDEFVLTTVTDGLRQLRDKRDLKIRANPGDFRFLREHKEDLIASFDGIQSVDVIEDRRVDKGGCLIESTNGHLDGRIETQLKEVERALLEAHEEGRHGTAA